MKKEKYITQVKTKTGISFRVAINVNGKKKRFGTFHSKDYETPGMALEAARMCRDEAVLAIKQNRFIPDDVTVDDMYIKSKELICTNVKTQRRHDDSYNAGIPPEIRSKPIGDITAADVQRTLNEYAATHSQGQLNKLVTVWRQIYQTCFLMELPIVDRSRMVKIPKSKIPTRRLKKHCTEEELEAFLECLAKYGNDRKLTEDVTFAIRIMQHLGLRPQEALAVCADDVDLQNQLFYVKHSVGSDSENTRKLITTKTPWSVRTLPIPDALVPILDDLLTTRHTEPLLTASDGLPYEIDMIDDLMLNVSKKSGVKVSMYMMRHNFATAMVKKDIRGTQDMMGHNTAVMTLRYVENTPIDKMKEMLNKMN